MYNGVMSLQIYLFGAPRFAEGECALHVQRRKARALLAYLALNRQPQTRELLATLFYPESDNALAYLRRDLSEVRRQVGEEILRAENEVSLNPGAEVWVDVLAFQARLDLVAAHGHFPQQPCAECLAALQEAIALYSDDFLAGFILPDCAAFEEWQFFQGQALRQGLAQALEKMVAWHAAQRAYAEAISAARRWLALDPLHEAAQRRLMELYAASGQRAAALRQYEECQRLLDEDWGVVPETETTALFEAIRTGQFQLAPKDGEEGTRRTATQNLPAQCASFVARDEELVEVRRTLSEAGCRLLTLVGPGGVGKTRLALEAAREMQFGDGLCFAPLAALNTGGLLPGAVADALEVRLYGEERSLEALLEQLRPREMLLILDNFEQLLPEGADFVAAVLEHAPNVKLLVTSRQRLHLRAEWAFVVSGLHYPTEENADELESFGAAQLFLQRVRQARGELALSPQTRTAIARICSLTQGMPLALELAAAWTTTLSCTEIAEEIQRSVDFLAAALRDLPDRHRSMRAVFDSSWELLDDEERELFRQLSLFRNGFTRAAAEAVCRLPGGSRSILPVLAALVGKSLLTRVATGRYEIHELMRQYGAARLAQDPEKEYAARQRHSQYYLELYARQEGRLKGPRQQTALHQLRAELANLRLAWQHAARHGRSQLIMGAAEGAWLFLQQSSHINFQEQGALYDLALSRVQRRIDAAEASGNAASAADELALGKLQALKVGMCMRMGDLEQALMLAHESLAQLRRLQAWREVAFALNMLAATVHVLGDHEAECAYLQESITLARETGARWLLGYSLNDLGMATHLMGDTREAQRLSRESMALFRQMGDWRGLAFALDNMGLFAFQLSAFDEAEEYYRECLSIRQASEDMWGVAKALSHLVMVARARGDKAMARADLLQAVRAARQAAAWSQLLDTLVQLAELLQEEGETTQAQTIVRCCLAQPALSDAARESAERLAGAWPIAQDEAAMSTPAPTLEELLASLLEP